ncbi:MAG: ABC transporter permease [Candidatus Desulfofervidaceae bacterium]|nr:ABC transporter permease [Candidatus Desulfofervidaceae bacterium]
MERLKLFLSVVFQILKVHKRRTLLSMLGVLFGIFSLVAVGHISNAMTKKIKDTLNKFGPNLIIVRAGKVHVTGRGMKQFTTTQTLKMSDAKAIKTSIKGIKEVVPISEITYPLRYKEKSMQVKIIGATPNIAHIRNLTLQDGFFYGDEEEKRGLKKAVLGYKVWQTLFGEKRAFGKTILIWRVPCEVIGVLVPKGADLSGEDLDSVVYLPLRTVMRRFLNVDYLSGLLIQAEEGTDLVILKAEIRKLLRRRHGLTPMIKDDFSIYSLEDIAKTKQEGLMLVSLLSKMAAIISFAIGGLGIFAVMLLTVTERQKEIGIRRAVGARKKDILWQFLGEACIISFLGGIAGVTLGILVAIVVSLVAALPVIFNLSQLGLSLLISLGLGTMAGAYPAYLAASLLPLKALRE